MMNKKAFEMSVGLIVVLILSILIFSLSLYFVFKWFAQAEQLKAEIDRQTQEQIITALKTGTQLVAIPISIQEAKRGTSTTFGIGVRNLDSEKPFSMATSFSGAYTPDGKTIPVDETYIGNNWLGSFATIPTFAIKKNDQKVIPILIRVPTNIAPSVVTQKGDYAFNVCVYDRQLRSDGSPPAPCTIGQFQTSSQEFYTGKIYQITVRVV